MQQVGLVIHELVIGQPVKLPFYNTRVPAGFPSPANDSIRKRIDLNELLISHPAASYIAEVVGNSMEKARIYDGDLILVDRAIEPVHGKVVVARMHGELTLKRIKMDKGRVWLIPESDDYQPVEVTEDSGLEIDGVVKCVLILEP